MDNLTVILFCVGVLAAATLLQFLCSLSRVKLLRHTGLVLSVVSLILAGVSYIRADKGQMISGEAVMYVVWLLVAFLCFAGYGLGHQIYRKTYGKKD